MKSSSSRIRAALHTSSLESLVHYKQAPDRHPNPRVIPPCYIRFELMTGGRGWVQYGKIWKEVLPGHLLWNNPGDLTIGRSDFKNPYQCLSGTLVTSCKSGIKIPRISFVPNLEEVTHFTHEVVDLFEEDAFDRQVLRDYVVGRIHYWIQMHRYKSRHDQTPLPIQIALQWIHENYSSPCSIQEIARQAGWSAAHLHDAFKKYLDITPHHALMNRRLRAAKERLVSSTQSIKQIAAECGFSDTSALTHTFRAIIGLTPKSYRQRYMGMTSQP